MSLPGMFHRTAFHESEVSESTDEFHNQCTRENYDRLVDHGGMTEQTKMETASIVQDLHILFDMLSFSALGDVRR